MFSRNDVVTRYFRFLSADICTSKKGRQFNLATYFFFGETFISPPAVAM